VYTKVKKKRFPESARSERFRPDEGGGKSHILYMDPAPENIDYLSKPILLKAPEIVKDRFGSHKIWAFQERREHTSK
jgi:hypothetical protein